jgi:hypothetical protein
MVWSIFRKRPALANAGEIRIFIRNAKPLTSGADIGAFKQCPARVLVRHAQCRSGPARGPAAQARVSRRTHQYVHGERSAAVAARLTGSRRGFSLP